MSKILTAILATTALGSGYLLGNGQKPDGNYSIIRENGVVMLEAKSIGKEYPLIRVGNEIYLGDSAHNYAGLKALIEKELEQKTAKKFAADKITEGLEKRVKE